MQKKKKLKSLSFLCKKLDKVFSEYIRRKDADGRGFVKCFTCMNKKHWKEMQCGHFISRRHYNTRWDVMNCKPQDAACNIFNQGNAPMFALGLQKLYGEGIIEELVFKKNITLKMNRFLYELMIEEYEEKLKNLKV